MRCLSCQRLLLRIFLKKANLLSYQSVIFLSFITVPTNAQVIKWDFDGGTGTNMPSLTIPNVSASGLSQKNNYGTTILIDNSSSSSGYTGFSGSYNAGAATVSSAFDASTSTYFEFTLTPEQGYSFALSRISFGSRSTTTGPKACSIRSSIDSYSSDIAANSLPIDSKWYLYQNTVLGISSTASVTFRIYGFDGAGAKQNVAVWRIDDLSLDVTVSPVQTYYRSRQSGNWSSSSTWEYSTDNVNWKASSKSPTSDAESILIQPFHTVAVATSVSLDQTTIKGTLELQTGGVLNINDGTDDDITIPANGVLQVTSTSDYSTSVQQSSGANINISSGGKITIGDGSASTGNGYEAFATSTANVWNDGSIYEYDNNGVFQIADSTYFPNCPTSDVPIFRITKVNGNAVVGYPKQFHLNGLFELSTDVIFSGSGKKYFRNGIRGTATITQLGAGKFYLDNHNAILDGSALNLFLTQPMDLGSEATIPSGAVVTVLGSNLSNSSGKLTVNGTLDMTTSTITNSSGGVIVINGTYRTSKAGGFSGDTSSIPSKTGTITLKKGSTIELYADGDQNLNARDDFSNLVFSGSGTKTPTGSFSPAGTVTIKDDAVFDCRGRNIGDETESGPTTTNLTMSDNSRLIVDTYGPNPKMAGTYNLTGGVIEFNGSNGTPTTIRSKNYQNIEVSGNNVSMSQGNITLNSKGTFAVKSGGIFTINDNTINGSGDGTQTVTVEGGALFKCGTNKGFNGFTITPAPIKSSAINSDIKNIILEPNSTVEYSRSNPPLSDGDQPITNSNGLVYQNLVISGTGNKTAPSDNLIIQGNLSKTSGASFVHNNGTVFFNGRAEQNYSCISPQMTFYDLKSANAVGLNVNDNLSVYDLLSLEDNSITNLKADITLLSNKDRTASIGQLSTNAIINYYAGRFIFERYINTNSSDGGHQKSWQLLSTPAFGETIFDSWQEGGSKTIKGYGTWITAPEGVNNGFDASSYAPSMKYYDADSDAWIGVTSTKSELANKEGYMLFVRGDRLSNSVNSAPTPTILRIRGKLYSPANLPPTSTVPPGKFQCVGNPFASVIDFEKINSSNIASSYYAWDPALGGSYGYGGYQTISAATDYLAVPGGTSNYSSTAGYQYIQSGQAFFVMNYTSSEASLTFPETCKATGNYHLVTRQAENERSILFANLISTNGRVLDGNAVSFSKDFSDKMDGDDVKKIEITGENFALKISRKKFVVEARNEIAVADTLFYLLTNLKKQDYKLLFAPRKIKTDLEAWLGDNFLHTEKPISLTDTSYINFSVTEDEASSDAGRFYLVFRGPEAGPLPVTLVSMNGTVKNQNVIIEWHVENETGNLKEYEIAYSVDAIHFTKIGVVASGNSSRAYYFISDQTQYGTGFYKLTARAQSGAIEVEKIIKINLPERKTSISVYPNPVTNNQIDLQMNGQEAGKYYFTLFNMPGQKIFSKEANYSGENIFSLKITKNLSAGIYQLEITNPSGEKTTLKIKRE